VDGHVEPHIRNLASRNFETMPQRTIVVKSGKPETPQHGAGRMGKIFSTSFSATQDPVQRVPAGTKIKCCGGLRIMSEPPFRSSLPPIPRLFHLSILCLNYNPLNLEVLENSLPHTAAKNHPRPPT
jgi:hypothetical protein